MKVLKEANSPYFVATYKGHKTLGYSLLEALERMFSLVTSHATKGF